MSRRLNHAAPLALTILLALGTAACNTRARGTDEVASAPVGTSAAQPDTAGSPRTEVLGATEVPPDTPPAGPAKPIGADVRGHGDRRGSSERHAAVQGHLDPGSDQGDLRLRQRKGGKADPTGAAGPPGLTRLTSQ